MSAVQKALKVTASHAIAYDLTIGPAALGRFEEISRWEEFRKLRRTSDGSSAVVMVDDPGFNLEAALGMPHASESMTILKASPCLLAEICEVAKP